MLSNVRLAQDTQADTAPATSSRELRFLWVGGAFLVAGCIAYLALFQSSSLWSRAIPLPGGENGLFGAIRNLFPTDWRQASRGSDLGLPNSGIYLVILAALFAIYWLTLRRASLRSTYVQRQGKRTLGLILLVTTLALFVLFWMPGTQSADLHSYIWYGRILATFGDNPFVHIPLEYVGRDAGDWLSQVAWKDVPSVYGPVWVLLAGGVAWLGNLVSSSDMWPHLLGHKLLAAGAHLVNIVLMWRVSGLVAQPTTDESSQAHRRTVASFRLSSGDELANFRPSSVVHSSQVVATLVYAWCPLALIEFGGNGHNDALMLTGVMSALWLHLTGRWRWAVVALALAALVKVAAILLLPGYLWLIFWNPVTKRSSKQSLNPEAIANSESKVQNRFFMMGQAVCIVVGTWILFYLPFWEGPVTLHPLLGGPASTRFTNSLASMLRYTGAEWLHSLATLFGWEELARQSVNSVRYSLELPLRVLTFSISALVALIVTWRGRTFPRMAQAWGWMLFVYLTVGAVWFWPWYATWLLPIAALAYRGRLFTAIQLLCATSLILYAVYPLMPPPLGQVPYYRSLLTIAPPLLYLAFSRLQMVARRHKL